MEHLPASFPSETEGISAWQSMSAADALLCGLKFFIYEQPELNHAWLGSACPKFHHLRAASKAENTAEVGMHNVLKAHPSRTFDASEAALFFVPVYECDSQPLQPSVRPCPCLVNVLVATVAPSPPRPCALALRPDSSNFVKNCTDAAPTGLREHGARMQAAHDALLASTHWQAHGGRDHVWASTAFSAHSYSLEKRMQPLSKLLGCSAVGRYKAGPFVHASRVGECVVDVPYQASLHVMRVAEAASSSSSAEWAKSTFLFFAGSLDVCCTGKAIRWPLLHCCPMLLGFSLLCFSLLPSPCFSLLLPASPCVSLLLPASLCFSLPLTAYVAAAPIAASCALSVAASLSTCVPAWVCHEPPPL